MVVALVNNKGGVGKTTTAVNLAAGLASERRRVLLVDLDSQGSASLSLGVPRAELDPSSADAVLDEALVQGLVRQTEVVGLSLVTGSMALANADLVLGNMAGRELRLREALEPVRSEYPFIIIDCPPSLSILSITALVAADGFLVPVTPQYLALEGLVNLMEAVKRMRTGIGTVASLLGLVLTMADYRNRVTGEIANLIRGHYGEQMFETEIRVNTRLAEAPSFGKTIFEYDASSTGAQAYGRLVDEFLRRCRRDGMI